MICRLGGSLTKFKGDAMTEPKWVQESFRPLFELANYFGTYLKEQYELYNRFKDNDLLKKSILTNIETSAAYQNQLLAELQKLVFLNAGVVKDLAE